MSWLLYPWERDPGTHWIGGWVDPRISLDTGVETNLAPAVNQAVVIQPVACHYTEWGIPALIITIILITGNDDDDDDDTVWFEFLAMEVIK
jgi:hypothetical protein